MQFDPVHAGHAIEQVVFALRFDGVLEDPSLLSLRSSASHFERDLPGEGEISGISINFGAPLPGGAPLQPGFLRRKGSPTGLIEKELRVERSSITFITNIYSRWNDIWPEAERYFSSLAPEYLRAGLKIMGLGLIVVDKFVASSGVSNPRPDALLNRDSNFFARSVLSAVDLWHNHTGFFEKPDEKTKRLVNVNIDCVNEKKDGADRRVVIITKIINDAFNQPGSEPSNFDEDGTMLAISAHMSSMHKLEKSILKDIINQEMATRIALK